ncbi:hypothetical protein [Methylorubrum thiocyanatum]|uniref:Uncharacterized protein n=1 Tax=Methylorubrum thiocyanatum TaxID=47958 RepID=A0AA40VDA9_9HYPH|nr:hypothetical protein [Methylorubrum thiocyanatum]MBA8915792.1 hypothetical protein [Methylorubrum thiocyanatum]GJE81236.1 hypothetical protein CJNNKLLH_2584 [Methylorubrum thiocyanatum]
MNIQWGKWGIEARSRNLFAIVSRGDLGVRVGPYGMSIMWGHMPITGVFVEGSKLNRHWHWDEVRAWFTRKPIAPLDAV